MGRETMPGIARQLAQATEADSAGMVETEVRIGRDNYVLQEDAFKFLDSEWRKAMEKYDLQPEGTQKALAQITLLTLGIEAASERDSHIVEATDVLHGWNRVRVCGIGEHPHQCLGKAIVDRQGQLLTGDDLVGQVLRETVKELDIHVSVDAPKVTHYRSSE